MSTSNAPLSPLPTPTLHARDGILTLEGCSLAQLAEKFGTPTYVYSKAALTAAFEAWQQALSGHRSLICYAVKANSNLGILSVFARLGAGFDIVSGGELARVLAAGGQASKVVFSGVGKTRDEMRQALKAGIRCFNVESATELERLDAIAGELDVLAPVALRVNPDVDPKTHPYISTGLKGNKFGVAFADAQTLYRRAAALPNLRITGVACHIGSQLLDPAPMAEAAQKVADLVDRLAGDGITLDHIDLGGGLGIRYRDEAPPVVADYLAPLLKVFEGRSEELCFEPGRSLVGNAGVLLTEVLYLKPGPAKNFCIVDAAMNDLVRPALYEAWMAIEPLQQRATAAQRWDVVGPVCESGDWLGRERDLALAEGDFLAVLSAGAYGMTMASNYNTRPRAAEVMVVAGDAVLVREREPLVQLFGTERRLPTPSA